MSEMENDTRDFLVKIASSLSMGLLWLVINSTVGIYFGLGFFEGSPSWKNIVFYVWFVGSFVWLVFYYKKKWDF